MLLLRRHPGPIYFFVSADVSACVSSVLRLLDALPTVDSPSTLTVAVSFASPKIAPGVPAQLLEYDKRFEQYGAEFTFYDYNQPEDLPLSLKHSFEIVVADPPYQSKECLEKVAETIRFLSIPGESYVLLLTDYGLWWSFISGSAQRFFRISFLTVVVCLVLLYMQLIGISRTPRLYSAKFRS